MRPINIAYRYFMCPRFRLDNNVKMYVAHVCSWKADRRVCVCLCVRHLFIDLVKGRAGRCIGLSIFRETNALCKFSLGDNDPASLIKMSFLPCAERLQFFSQCECTRSSNIINAIDKSSSIEHFQLYIMKKSEKNHIYCDDLNYLALESIFF